MTDEKNNIEKSEVEKKKKSVDPLDMRGDRTVGEILLEAREKSGQSLEALSLESRIPTRSLQYLETDNYEAFPAKVYVQGFLRTYSRLLGLDVRQILSKFELQTGQTHKSRGDLWEVEETFVEESVPSTHIFRRYLLPTAGIAALVILIIWGIARLTGDDVKPPEDMPGTGENIETVGDSVILEQEGTEPAGDSGENKTDDDDRAESTGNLNTDEEKSPEQNDVVSADVAASPAPERVAQSAMELRIIAKPADTTWFDMIIYNISGSETDSIFRDFILYPDQVERLTATGSFFFKTIGNAGGFWLERDGERLKPLGEHGEVIRNVIITRAEIRLE
ncbi:MAG: helix-turn-helix domain-containing protein [Candidatus Krumholzibacteria bacterium]|nr:helix-turn-helix domain-containing protein [Candidatus Krumholzibacteria bacterium]